MYIFYVYRNRTVVSSKNCCHHLIYGIVYGLSIQNYILHLIISKPFLYVFFICKTSRRMNSLLREEEFNACLLVIVKDLVCCDDSYVCNCFIFFNISRI